jgi:general stress protein 26
MSTTFEHQQATAKLAALIRDIPVAMLTTRTADGTLRSRPMINVNDKFQGDLWFFTRNDAPLVADVEADSGVNVSFTSINDRQHVSASGRASITQDRKRIELLWNDACDRWFENGVDDPKLALICVDVAQGEYWDVEDNGMVAAKGFLKQLAGRKSVPPVDHAVIDWSSPPASEETELLDSAGFPESTETSDDLERRSPAIDRAE